MLLAHAAAFGFSRLKAAKHQKNANLAERVVCR
jgi:hypothetical protein